MFAIGERALRISCWQRSTASPAKPRIVKAKAQHHTGRATGPRTSDSATRDASVCSSRATATISVSAPLRPRSAFSLRHGMSCSSLELHHRWDALPGPCLQVRLAVVEVVAEASSRPNQTFTLFVKPLNRAESSFVCCPGPAGQCITPCTNTLEHATACCCHRVFQSMLHSNIHMCCCCCALPCSGLLVVCTHRQSRTTWVPATAWQPGRPAARGPVPSHCRNSASP